MPKRTYFTLQCFTKLKKFGFFPFHAKKILFHAKVVVFFVKYCIIEAEERGRKLCLHIPIHMLIYMIEGIAGTAAPKNKREHPKSRFMPRLSGVFVTNLKRK